MNSRKLSDWAEILASVAVLCSLVFLIAEVRTQTRAIERQAAYQRAASLTTPFFESEVLRSASGKVRDRDGMSRSQLLFQERYGMTAAEAEVWGRHLLELWYQLRADYDFGNREAALRMAEAFVASSPDLHAWASDRLEVGLPPISDDFGEAVRVILARTPGPDG